MLTIRHVQITYRRCHLATRRRRSVSRRCGRTSSNIGCTDGRPLSTRRRRRRRPFRRGRPPGCWRPARPDVGHLPDPRRRPTATDDRRAALVPCPGRLAGRSLVPGAGCPTKPITGCRKNGSLATVKVRSYRMRCAAVRFGVLRYAAKTTQHGARCCTATHRTATQRNAPHVTRVNRGHLKHGMLKMAVLVYKALNGLLPQYLANDCRSSQPLAAGDFDRLMLPQHWEIDPPLLLVHVCGTIYHFISVTLNCHFLSFAGY